MALTRSAARRYAEAAFQLAERDGSVDAWLAGLESGRARLASPEVLQLLSNPALPAAARLTVLDRLLGEDVGGSPRKLLALLVQRGRVDLLADVEREFVRLHHRRAGVVEASVTSAAPLDTAAVDDLQARLAALTGQTVRLSLHVDPALLGGLTVRIGDRLIDGSARGRLERLRADLTNLAT